MYLQLQESSQKKKWSYSKEEEGCPYALHGCPLGCHMGTSLQTLFLLLSSSPRQALEFCENLTLTEETGGNIISLIILKTANWFNSLWSQWLCPAQFSSRPHISFSTYVSGTFCSVWWHHVCRCWRLASNTCLAQLRYKAKRSVVGCRGLGWQPWMQVRRAVRHICTHLWITTPWCYRFMDASHWNRFWPWYPEVFSNIKDSTVL